MAVSITGILKRFAKWLVVHGLEEAQQELERRRSNPPEPRRPPSQPTQK